MVFVALCWYSLSLPWPLVLWVVCNAIVRWCVLSFVTHDICSMHARMPMFERCMLTINQQKQANKNCILFLWRFIFATGMHCGVCCANIYVWNIQSGGLHRCVTQIVETKTKRRMRTTNRKRTVSFNWHFYECESYQSWRKSLHLKSTLKLRGSLFLSHIDIGHSVELKKFIYSFEQITRRRQMHLDDLLTFVRFELTQNETKILYVQAHAKLAISFSSLFVIFCIAYLIHLTFNKHTQRSYFHIISMVVRVFAFAPIQYNKMISQSINHFTIIICWSFWQ